MNPKAAGQQGVDFVVSYLFPRALMRGMVALMAAIAAPSPAQMLDPKVLESLQAQLGAAEAARSANQAASSVQQSSGPQLPMPQQQVGQIDTEEEQEVRRARARRELAGLYKPSPIEEDFRRRTGDGALRQFGYSFFQSAAAPTGIRTGSIGDDYILGIGDEVQVSFRGSTNQTSTVRVDRNGMVVVGQLPPIRAAGRSLGSLRAEIGAQTDRTMLATDVFVTVGDVRAISVFIGGEVERPGQYNLTSLSDIGTAVAQAGGIRLSGSLRQVRLVRASGATQTVDLYGLLGIGAPPRVRVQDGDRIIVPVIGRTIAITGQVPRPGIYELPTAAPMAQVLAFAGGAVRGGGAEYVVSRIRPDGNEQIVQLAQGDTVRPGDGVIVRATSQGGAVGRVSLLGHVASPGIVPLAAASTVADLLRSPANLYPDTYQLLAVLIRRDPVTGARGFLPIDLSREFGQRSTRLLPDDQLLVMSNRDVARLTGPAEPEAMTGQGMAGTNGDGRATGSPDSPDSAQGRENEARENPAGTSRARADQPEDRNDEAPNGPFHYRAIERQVPGIRALLIEKSVRVDGAVRRPGRYPLADAVSVDVLVRAAEGLSSQAFDVVAEISRVAPGPLERISLGPQPGSGLGVLVQPGDSLNFTSQRSELDAGVVRLSGEINRPGSYSIRRGETLGQLLQRADGLTVQAYAFGAVFTRQSVALAQQEGFRRTARELYNGLFAVTARSDNNGSNNLSGAVSLIQAIASAEAPGRVVVEADPRVLALRPDLDTVLEPGDEIFIPRTPNYVLALGDVQNPGALQFSPTRRAQDYVRQAGGTLPTSDRGRAFVVLPNGTAEPVSIGGWGGGGLAPPPGSTIIVPKNIDPLFRLTVIRDLTTIVAQLATSVATVAVLATR